MDQGDPSGIGLVHAGYNRDRVICRVNYEKGIVSVLEVMDQGEYDKDRWKTECSCFDPPPAQVRDRSAMAVRTALASDFRLVERFPPGIDPERRASPRGPS
jgi:hypothetical protein